MKWKAKPYLDEEEWHRVFAWFPVKTQDYQWIWLEEVYKKLIVTAFDIYTLYKEAPKL